ncbi:hypothetical protein [Pandoraea oxalativorans]|nr:hypothetical protein [Pandoraea oxalativorans]
MSVSLKSAKQGGGVTSGQAHIGRENEDAIVKHSALLDLSADATRILTTMRAAVGLIKEGVYRTET